MKLGQFISLRRKHLGLTQEQLAEKIHVSKSAVAKWESEGGIPDRDNFYRLADELGVTVNDLHKIINSKKQSQVDLQVNITPEVIGILESYGYKVIRPEEGEE